MIYLIFAIVSSALISIFMRLSKSYIENEMALLAVNYFICILCSLFYIQDLSIHISDSLGIFNGFFYWISFVLFQKNIQKNGLILSSTFQKLGILIPVLFTIFVLKEYTSYIQLSGVILSIICIYLLQKSKEKQEVQSLLLLCLLLFFNGSADAMAKIFERVGNNEDVYLCITFVIAFILCSGSMIIQKTKITKKEIVFGILIGIPNYFSARFLLKSLYSLPALIVYPSYSVFTILVVSFFGIFLFKEKISKKHIWIWIGFLLSLVLLNVK